MRDVTEITQHASTFHHTAERKERLYHGYLLTKIDVFRNFRMPKSCAAYGCTPQKGEKLHFFRFPKDKDVLWKTWFAYCKRQFEPTQWHVLCLKHFSDEMFERNPKFMEHYGYKNAKPKLKSTAIPDVPLQWTVKSVNTEVRGAVVKRRQRQVSVIYIHNTYLTPLRYYYIQYL
jgi:hypothetical protein